MADDKSLGAPKEEKRVREEEEEGSKVDEEEEEDEELEEEKPLPKLQESLPCVSVPDSSSLEVELRGQSSQSETLVVPPPVPSSEKAHGPGCRTFSQLLAGAMASPTANSTAASSNPMVPTVPVDPTGFPMVCSPVSLDPAGFKGQFGMSHQEALASVTAQAQAQKQLQIVHPSSSAELSPTSVPQSMPSEPSPAPQEQKVPPLPQETDICTSELDCQNSDRKTKSSHMVTKTPTSDGYNWRKYGQKQVKSTESSRSYYRCTYSNCHAKKKVERCDHTGFVTEIIYKGRHNHDPPRKIRCTKARRFVSSASPVGESETIDNPVKKLESDPSTPKKELREAIVPTPEKKRPISSASNGRDDMKAEGEHVDEQDAKRRIKDTGAAYSTPLFKTVKEPKIVVQAAGDVGISGDGYRWRKYGQKMVKGNPYPRSYYKCTSAGCPVRKHVERATDDTSAIIITYEGKHDHDMPVPKKRHGPPSAALLIAAAAAMNSAQIKKSEALPNQRASTQWSMDIDSDLIGEKALELGGEKALESARTLLSIGIELKPC
ncbi:PREDICTED: probable WRKY transcription factor 32 [Nelumbo nucifera]|uniref:WRKY domain-containing protein n=2 Tax=Nelumbo nucifera TaxID=4432 RepID=A0A822Y5X8_NELNU|nr:PREDICTED: probable WRKY transcription factor 32 [Nelumbo nucifera]DAD27423.1 TPA_asm: hypothetical protein HUJ06_028891 [Nelumbo nucifera]